MAYVRTVKTSSGATAVQIVWSSWRGSRSIEHLGSDDMLLYASDYPHWQFDGDAILPKGLSPELRRKVMVENPRKTYRSLSG